MQRLDQPGAGRVHQHVLDGDVGARHDQRRHQREGGRGRIARHGDRAARRACPRPSMRMWRTPSASVSTSRSAPKPVSIFSVWSRVMTGSIDRGDARRVEAGEQHGGFDLRGRHRHAVVDRRGAPGPRSVSGRRSPWPRLQHLRADRAQRIEHAPHGPLGQRGIADEGGLNVIGADQPHGQPRAGAGIAEIERRPAASSRQPLPTPSTIHSSPRLLDHGAHGPHRRRRCAARPRLPEGR